ncbi:MAG TPA: hypothetical protein VF659_07085 [Pyrinomonadaceae bacterium]|jgi:hypothetical protein
MAETDEKAGAGGGVARESGAAGEEGAELRAEEESAKAMEAEVPHSAGYEDPGQEPPEDSGRG